MTYHHIRTPAQHFTPGADEKRAACDGRWEVFDALIDHQNGPVALTAKRRALEICGACKIRKACWTANRDEVWLQRMLDRQPAPTVARQAADQLNSERREEVHFLIDQGADMATTLRALGITRDAFLRWCRRTGHMAEWEALGGGKSKPKKKARCGTESGYYRHRRLKQKVCDECREAKNALERERYRKRVAA